MTKNIICAGLLTTIAITLFVLAINGPKAARAEIKDRKKAYEVTKSPVSEFHAWEERETRHVGLVSTIQASAGAVVFSLAVVIVAILPFRQAYPTDRLCRFLEASVSNRLKNIEESLSAMAAPALNGSQPKGYLFFADGKQQGPVSASDLRGMRQDGLITHDTPVMREGEIHWRKFQDFLSLTR